MTIIMTANDCCENDGDSKYFISICVLASLAKYQLGTTFVMLSSQKNNYSDNMIEQAFGFYPNENTISYRGLTSQAMPSKLRNRLLYPEFMVNVNMRHISFVIDEETFSNCNRFIAEELDIGPNAKQESFPDDLPQFQTCEHNCWRYSCNFLEKHAGINAEDYLLTCPLWNLPTTIFWQLGAARFEKTHNKRFKLILSEKRWFRKQEGRSGYWG